MKVDQQLMKTQEDRYHRSSDIDVGDEVLVNVQKCDRPVFSSIHTTVQTLLLNHRAFHWMNLMVCRIPSQKRKQLTCLLKPHIFQRNLTLTHIRASLQIHKRMSNFMHSTSTAHAAFSNSNQRWTSSPLLLIIKSQDTTLLTLTIAMPQVLTPSSSAGLMKS